MRGGYVNNHAVPLVRTDPENRCAAMLVYGRQARSWVSKFFDAWTPEKTDLEKLLVFAKSIILGWCL
jgi:hypothetical protein